MNTGEMVPAGKHLRSVYIEKLEKNPSYSLRAFARDLKVSHSHLSRLMSGKRNLSLRQAVAVSDYLHMTPEAKQLFLRHVAETKLVSPPPVKPKSTFVSEPGMRKFLNLEVDQFRVMSEWYHSAILELMNVKGFQPTPTWVAKQLGISSRLVRAAVGRLTRLGLIEVTDTGWKRTHRHLMIATKPSGALRSFHRQMIEKALEELNYGKDPVLRDITGTTIAIDPELLPQIKKRIGKFRKSLMDFAAGGNPSTLYQMNVQFFPLVKSKNKIKRIKT